MKLLIDTVRLWSIEQGLRVFHLGGGVAAQKDPLFSFKAGFSDERHPFTIWRWTVLPDVYAQLVSEKALWNESHNMQATTRLYFPEYRYPAR
jgi:hypothetical protein